MADPIAPSLLDGQPNYGAHIKKTGNMAARMARQGPKCMSDGGVATFGWPWPDGSVTVAVASAEGYTVGSASSATTMVNDDDVLSEITISPGASPVKEGRGALFKLTASPAPGVNLKVKLKIAEAAGSDFVAPGDEGAQTVTIGAGSPSATYTVDTVADRVDEPDGSVTVRVESGEGYTVGSTSSAAVAVEDNDARALVLTPTSKLSVKEGGNSTYTVRLATEPTGTATVAITSDDPDVTVSPTSLTFDPSGTELWSTPQTVTVRAEHDDDGSDESVLLRHFVSGGDYGTSQDTKLKVSVKDDDPVELDISKGVLTVVEGDNGDFRVRLATEPTATVMVAITSNNPGVTVSPKSLTFNASGGTDLWSEAQRVTVSAAEDDDAGHYSAKLNLTASGGGYKGKSGAVQVAVTDNDARGLSLSPDALLIPEASSHFYTVRLATEPTATVTVAITSDDPDVTVSPNLLTFNASGGTKLWNTEQMVAVSAAEDDNGVSETVTLTHSPSGGDYGSSENQDLSVAVTDDDPRGLLLSTTKVFVSEDGSSTYTVRLATEPTATVTVAITSDDPDVTVSPAELTFTASGGSAWNMDQTVTVSAGADGDRQNERATLTHTARGGDYGNQPLNGIVEAIVSEAQPLRQPNMPRINILRYGKHVPGQRPAGAHIPVIEGTAASFTVIASSDWQPDGPVTITVLVSEDESDGQDFVAPGDEKLQTVTLHPWRDGLAKLYQVPTVNDATKEPNGAVTVKVMPGVDYIAGSSGTVELFDNDMDKGLVFLVPLGTDSVGMGEGSGTFYRVRLAAPPTGEVTVTVSGHPTGANPRFTVDRTTLIFTPENWIEPQPVSVFANSDADIDDEEYRLLHTASGGGYDSVSKRLLAFVIDDDPEHRKTDTLELMFHPENNPRSHRVTEGDSGTRSKSFYVRTDKPYASELGFRLCFGGGANWGEDYRLRHRDRSDWTDVELTDGCFDTHIPANERHRELGIEVLGDVCPEAETEVVNIHLMERHDRLLPPPREIDSVHHTSGVYIRDDDRGKPVCTGVRSDTAPSVPDTAVANVQVSSVDDTSASASWDAVAHATSYEVSWDGSGSQTAVNGAVRVTGTSATIEHGAQEAMTLTLTVTPEYVDENGEVQRLDALAATATLTVGPAGDALSADAQGTSSQAPSCVSAELMAEAQLAASETWRTSPGHVGRWSRVLTAFGEKNAYSNNPMTIAEAQAQADRGLQRWAPVAPALECLASQPVEDAQQEEEEEQPVTPTTPELSLSAGSAITEGGAASFTVTADPAPSSDITIAYTVAQSGEYLDAPGAGARTTTLAAGTTSVALSVATVDDAADEADGSVSVTLGTGTGNTVATGKGSTAVAVRDNDKPVVSITAGPGVTEGSPAAFTITADPVPAALLAVTLTITQSGDMAASGQTGTRTVTIPAAGTATFSVATDDDAADEPDGTITATIDTGTGYSIGSPAAATVTITDNDAATPSTGPTISIADATMNENQYNGWFTVTLSEKVAWPVHVYYATRDSNPVSAVAGQDYLAWKRSWRLRARFRPGQTETKIHVVLYNDSHDEDPETFEMVLFDAGVNGPPDVSVTIADGVATGTITNSDPMPAAFLSRFGRTVAQQALDGIETRLAAERNPGTAATIAGQALALGTSGHAAGNPLDDLMARQAPTDTDPFGHHPPEPLSMTAREALLASSFTTTGETASGSLAIWGRAARDSFDGQEGTFTLDGTATTAMLGADYGRDNWLIGLALLQSTGKGSYADTDVTPRPPGQICPEAEQGQTPCGEAIRAGDGKVKTSLTALVPYASIQTSERLRLWAALGYGTGEVTLKPKMGGSITADTSWQMAAAGLRAELAGSAGVYIALTSDALWSRTRSEKTHALAASDATVTRLRAGLEASWQVDLANGARLTPGLEIGARHDGGDAETGAGIEVGGSLAWTDPASGFSMDLSARKLIAHDDDDFAEHGLAASFTFDPRPDSARGLSVSLRQDSGEATGGVDTLFMPQALERQDTGSTATTAEAAYGLAALAGRFTIAPHARLRMDDASRDTTLGLRLTPERGAPDLSLGLEATRREHGAAAPVHGVGLGVSVRW